MALTSAKKTTATVTAALAGAALAAFGAQQMTQTASVSAPARSTAKSSAASSAPGSGSASAPDARSGGTLDGSGAPMAGSGTTDEKSSSVSGQGSPSESAHGYGPGTSSARPFDGVPAGVSTRAMAFSQGLEDYGKAVALTFDDGPDPRWTPQVLTLLAQHHAKATFCEIGPNAKRYPALVKEIVAAGDRLCDHSVHHDERQSHKSFDYNTHEIADAQQEITEAAGPGADIWYYRAPGGDFSPQIRGIAALHGLRPLAWNVDSDDWKRPGVDGILKNINRDLRPGSVILMHDAGGDRSESVQALARLLNQLDAQGYGYSFPQR